MTAEWDPERYLGFAEQRERPFLELVARVPTDPAGLVVDLGCGPATTTAKLLARWPRARVLGVDSSPAMLARAARLAHPPRLSLLLADVTTWEPDEAPDVILANAVWQWVPGHAEVIERLAGRLAPGGSIAFQVPGNFDAPSHVLLRTLVADGRWALPPGPVREAPVLQPAGYLERLARLGLDADVWETTYLHVLRGEDPVLEWVRGTALRPLLAALDPDDAASLEAAYGEALREAYPPDGDGRTILPFRRIFAVGHRPA